MKTVTQTCCPDCGRSMASALQWTRAVEPNGALVFDLDSAGSLKKVLDDPTVDFQCGGCGSTVRIGRDVPLAAA